jgi:hypothetical protein
MEEMYLHNFPIAKDVWGDGAKGKKGMARMAAAQRREINFYSVIL